MRRAAKLHLSIAAVVVIAVAAFLAFSFRPTVSSGSTDNFRGEARLPSSLRELNLSGHVNFAIVNYPPCTAYIISGTFSATQFDDLSRRLEIQPRVAEENFMVELDNFIKGAGLSVKDFVFPCPVATDYVGETKRFGYAWLCYCAESGRLTMELSPQRGSLP